MIIPDQYFKGLAIMFTKEYASISNTNKKNYNYVTDFYDKVIKKINFEDKDLDFIKHLSHSMVKNMHLWG